MPITRLHLPPARLLRRLPADGSPGWTRYGAPGDALELDAALDPEDADSLAAAAGESETGYVAIGTPGAVTLALPPFAVEGAERWYRAVNLGPFVAALEKRRSYGVILLRLGGFSLGFFRDRTLVDSRTDQRFVKGRHRKGGQSSTRFARIREKQIHELFGKTCAAVREKLAPYEAEIEHLFLGGDRRTLLAFRKECVWLERFSGRIPARVLPAPGDPRLEMLRAIPDEVWASDLYEAVLAPDVGAEGRAP